MSDRQRRTSRAHAAVLALSVVWPGCGPSAAELAARDKLAALQQELAEARQYNDDLKFRLQLAEARNKLLIQLVQGLTIDSEHSAPAPEKLASANDSLKSIDREVEALIATLRSSRQDAAALRGQRDALQRELADARRTIEHARAAQAEADARILTLKRIVAPLSELIRLGSVHLHISYDRLAIGLPESALFAQNRASITEDGQSLLQKVLTGLRTAPEHHIRVSGPVDPVNKHASAQRELTLVRSLTLLDYLRSHGVSAEPEVTTMHKQEQITSPDRHFTLSLVPTVEELPKVPSTEQLLAP